ncbi:MAG: DMT family transporter [Microcoleaceae cyanobacterium]
MFYRDREWSRSVTPAVPQWLAEVEFRVVIALVIGLVAISFSPIFVRLSQGELSPYATIFNRFWIASVTLGLWNGVSAIRTSKPIIPPLQQQPNFMRTMGLLLLMGTLLSTALILWAWSLTETSIANSSVIHSLAPMFTAFWGWLFLKRQFDRHFITGMMIAVGGTLIIGIHDMFNGGGQLQGDLVTLVSTILLGGYPLIEEHLKTQLTSQAIVKGSSIVGMGVALPIVLMGDYQLLPSSIHGWCSVISLAVVCQIIGVGLLAYCLNRFSAEFISICHLLTPIFSSVAAWIIFGEILGLDIWVGFSCVLVGIYFTLSSHSTIKKTDSYNGESFN